MRYYNRTVTHGRARWLGIILASALSAARPQPVHADWGFQKVFDFSDGYPGTGANISVSGTNPAIHNDIVMFGVSGGGDQGLFRYERGSLISFADTGPGDIFSSVSVSSFDVHDPFSAFVGSQGSGNGIYTRSVDNPNSAFPIATPFTSIPSGSGNFTSFGDHSIDAQRVTFIGFGAFSQRGIYVGDVNSANTPSLVIERGSNLPGGSFDTFQSFSAISHSGNTVVFTGAGTVSSGVYFKTISGLLTTFGTVASTTTTIPGQGTTFTSLSDPSFDGVSTAFRGFGSGGSGVYTNQGGPLRTVADTGTSIPQGVGLFTSIGQGSVSIDSGDIAFEASGVDSIGAYIEKNGVLEKVIAEGDVIDGRTVSSVSLGRDGLSAGSLAMRLSFTDGSSTFYSAFSEHRWDPAGGAGGNWDDQINWPHGAKPSTDVHTFIEPSGPALVVGPTTVTSMRSLTLGSQGAGVAELQLQTTGQVLIDETLTIQSAGKLSGNGALHAVGGINNAGEINLGTATISLSGGVLSNTGLLRGNGQVDNQLTNQTTGEVRASFSDTLRLTGNGNTNHGLMNVNFGGTIESPSGLTNSSTGTISADGILRVGQLTVTTPGGVPTPSGAGLINQGRMNFSGSTRVFGDVWTEGGNQSDIIASGGDVLTFFDDVYMYDDLAIPGKPEIRAGFNTTVVYSGLLKGDINKTGPGLHVIEGTQSAGFSPGFIAGSNELWTDTSTQEIDIAGILATTGSETNTSNRYSVTDITGELTIMDDATIVVDLIGPNGPAHNTTPFAPGLGETFNILHWGNLVADVSTVNFDFSGAPLASGLGWQATWGSTTNGQLTLEVVTAALVGDLDGDGFVGINDLNIVLANWNQSVPPGNPLADPSGDGFVGIADLNTVLGNWNAGTPPGYSPGSPLPGAGDTVPEPASAAMLCLGAVAILRRRLA